MAKVVKTFKGPGSQLNVEELDNVWFNEMSLLR
jgi:hypothetical protein